MFSIFNNNRSTDNSINRNSKRPVFLRAKWENLVMLNYEIDSKILLPHLPPATELDTFNNKTLVSVVGFMFNNTKVLGLRWPFHSNFEEVNLRFYVKHFDGLTWKRGVVFYSEIVPRPIIATIANLLYREHYSAKPMMHAMSVKKDEIILTYKWKHRKKWNSIDVTAEASFSDIHAGSEEEFIFEHYWGYNKYNEQTTIEYGVEHSMWQVHKVKEWKLDCDVASLYGEAFVPYLSAEPDSVFLAKGSEVLIRKPSFIKT
ncbi:YqjF family protein [Segetibacter koreensis]|uniref:YqjF family protein n=1 Tax=Segetibacter koreensis TaxID=398037 RepID=UPI0003780F6E|nr:DUF2071 domain-containing protein [Segetibacter koreensis]